MNILRGFALWLVDHVPMGRLAPHVFGFGIGSKPVRVTTPPILTYNCTIVGVDAEGNELPPGPPASFIP